MMKLKKGKLLIDQHDRKGLYGEESLVETSCPETLKKPM